MAKKNSKLFIPLLIITSVITGVAFFVCVKLSAEHSPDAAVDWDFAYKVSGYTFLGAWVFLGSALLLAKADRKKREALEAMMKSLAGELGLEYHLDNASNEVSISGELAEIPVTVSVRHPKHRNSSYQENGGPSEAPYTIFTVSIPGQICDARLCTKPLLPDGERVLTEEELAAIRERLKNIKLSSKMRKTRITKSYVICKLSSIMRSREEVASGLKTLREMAELLRVK